MTERPLLFAFLADRLISARIDISHDYELISAKHPDRGTILLEGSETPFVIITQPEQLRGLELCGWAFVRSATSSTHGIDVRRRIGLRQMANVMLRHPHKNNCNKPLAMPD